VPAHQSCRNALLHDLLEEASEDGKPEAFADAGEAGVVGEGIAQVIPNVPAQAQSIGNDPQ
jgi:hypothetical protein